MEMSPEFQIADLKLQLLGRDREIEELRRWIKLDIGLSPKQAKYVRKKIRGMIGTLKSLQQIMDQGYSEYRPIAPVESAVAGTPQFPSNQDNDEPPVAIASNPTAAIRCTLPPLDLTSDLGQKSKSRILEQLWSEIEAAQSQGIGWMSIRDMIKTLIDAHKRGA